MAEEKSKLDPKDFEGYGTEMIDMVKVVKDQAKEIDDLKGQVQNVGERIYESDEEKFYGKLAELVPDWQIINRDPGFVEWLSETNPLVGVTRQVLLDDAHRCLDVNRVAEFFEAFKGGGSSLSTPKLEPGAKVPTVTKAEFLQAQKDAQTGRMPYEEFEKIANNYQLSITKGRPA